MLCSKLELERSFFTGCPESLTTSLSCVFPPPLTELFFLPHTPSFSISIVFFSVQCTAFNPPSFSLKYFCSQEPFLPCKLLTPFCLLEKNYMYLKFWDCQVFVSKCSISNCESLLSLSCLTNEYQLTSSYTNSWMVKTEWTLFSSLSDCSAGNWSFLKEEKSGWLKKLLKLALKVCGLYVSCRSDAEANASLWWHLLFPRISWCCM